MKSVKTILAIFILLLTFSVYAFSLSPAPSGYADSDELLSTGYLFGVSHPSGYPMAGLISGIIFRLTPFLSVSHAGNLIAAGLHAISAVVLFYTLTLCFSICFPNNKSKWIQYTTASTASLLTAFSGMIWLWGGKLEVVSFTTLITSLIIYSSLKWYQQLSLDKPSKVYFYLTWILAGVGLAHVHVLVMLLPPLFILLVLSYTQYNSQKYYHRISAWIFGVLTFLLSFGLVNSLLLLFNSLKASVSWYFPQSLSGWMHLVSRRDYAGFFIEAGSTRPAYLNHFSPISYLQAQPYYFQFLLSHFTLIGFTLAIIGAIYLFRAHDKIKWYLYSLFLFQGIIFAGRLGYMPQPDHLEQLLEVGVMHRQYVAGEYIFGLFIGFGLYWLISMINQKLSKINPPAISIFILTACTLLVIALNTPIGFHRNNDFISNYAKSMLSSAATDSIIICSSDISCYTLLYESVVNGIRPDVTVLTKNPNYRRYFLDQNPEFYPSIFTDNPYFFPNLIAHNLPHRPVYLTNLDEYYAEYIGLDGNPFFIIPQGYLYQVVTDPTAHQPTPPDSQIASGLLNYKFSQADYYGRGLLDYFSDLHRSIGTIFSYYNLKDEAKVQLDTSVSLRPNSQLVFNQLETLPVYQGEQRYLQASATTSATLHQQALSLIEANQKLDGYDLLRKATYLDPYNPQLRIDQAQLLISNNYHTEAYQQLQQILLHYPDHQQALELSQQISSKVDYSKIN